MTDDNNSNIRADLIHDIKNKFGIELSDSDPSIVSFSIMVSLMDAWKKELDEAASRNEAEIMKMQRKLNEIVFNMKLSATGITREIAGQSLDLAVTKATEDASAMRQETKDLLSKALGKAIDLFNSSFDDSMKNLKKQIDSSVNELKSVDLSSEAMQKYVKPLPMLTKAAFFIAGMATVVILGFLVFLAKSF
ncbi:MAG: hypothetical protein IJ078_05780 [Succinivibrionaceae bacterium]|nr:hypothetical protein [Succinivibrionaceae bacterium]